MFYKQLAHIDNQFQSLFNFKIFYEIKENIDLQSSNISVNKDFIMIKLIGKGNQFCPIQIYLGIDKSLGFYGLYLNEKAIVYNYEKFESFSLFEKELYHFLSKPIKSETVFTLGNTPIYTNYFIADYENTKKPFIFRENHMKTWSNFLRLKKTKAISHNYEAWLSLTSHFSDNF